MASVIRGDDNFDSKPYATFPIGVPFEIWDHLAAILLPDNTGPIKFIKLTAGQSGVGEYNEGLLTDEQVSGSAPLVEADAEIATGPLAGQRVPLINTEGAFIRPGTDSGGLQFDQMQRITGSITKDTGMGLLDSRISVDGVTNNGALSAENHTGLRRDGANNSDNARTINFDSGGSPDARVSSTTSGETRPKNRQATYYMRIV